MKKHIHTLLALLLLLSPLAQTNANEQFVKEIEETRAIYLKAVNGNKRDLRKAIRHINKLSQKYPKHPLVMVYLGCSLAQRGRDIGERPLNRMRETEEGLRHIDRGHACYDATNFTFWKALRHSCWPPTLSSIYLTRFFIA